MGIQGTHAMMSTRHTKHKTQHRKPFIITNYWIQLMSIVSQILICKIEKVEDTKEVSNILNRRRTYHSIAGEDT